MGAREAGKKCDGCGAPKHTVALLSVYRISAGARIVLTFCARCKKIDDRLDDPAPPSADPAEPTPQEIVARRPRPARLRAWPALLPRLSR